MTMAPTTICAGSTSARRPRSSSPHKRTGFSEKGPRRDAGGALFLAGTIEPSSTVRAELVEARCFFSASEMEGKPFDRLRANGADVDCCALSHVALLDVRGGEGFEDAGGVDRAAEQIALDRGAA